MFSATTLEVWEAADGMPAFYGSSFIEYGLTPKLSLGGKVAQGSFTGVEMALMAGLSVLQKGPHQLSVELSIEQRALSRHAGVGLAYGRGLSLGKRSGWMSVETSIITKIEGPSALPEREFKLDATFGLSFESGWKVMAQIFSTTTETDNHIKLAPGVVMPLGKSTHVQFGLQMPAKAPEETAIVLGLWQSF